MGPLTAVVPRQDAAVDGPDCGARHETDWRQKRRAQKRRSAARRFVEPANGVAYTFTDPGEGISYLERVDGGMDETTLKLRRADEEDLSYVERLLERNELPTEDVRMKPGCFYVAYDGSDRVGVGGLEIDVPVGLLRSVVVERSVRGRGYGTRLCETLETRARSAGVETLYLLTTTASGFFSALDYAEIDRADAPDAVRRTTQFADLCPTTATCMEKSL